MSIIFETYIYKYVEKDMDEFIKRIIKNNATNATNETNATKIRHGQSIIFIP